MAYGQSGRIVLAARLLATKSSNQRFENDCPPRKQFLNLHRWDNDEQLQKREHAERILLLERVPQTCTTVNLLRLSQDAGDLARSLSQSGSKLETPWSAAQLTEAFSLRRTIRQGPRTSIAKLPSVHDTGRSNREAAATIA